MMGRFGRRLEWKQIRRPGIQTGKGEQSKLPAGSSVGIGHASQRTIVTRVPGADMWRARIYTMWSLWTDRGRHTGGERVIACTGRQEEPGPSGGAKL